MEPTDNKSPTKKKLTFERLFIALSFAISISALLLAYQQNKKLNEAHIVIDFSDDPFQNTVSLQPDAVFEGAWLPKKILFDLRNLGLGETTITELFIRIHPAETESIPYGFNIPYDYDSATSFALPAAKTTSKNVDRLRIATPIALGARETFRFSVDVNLYIKPKRWGEIKDYEPLSSLILNYKLQTLESAELAHIDDILHLLSDEDVATPKITIQVRDIDNNLYSKTVNVTLINRFGRELVRPD